MYVGALPALNVNFSVVCVKSYSCAVNGESTRVQLKSYVSPRVFQQDSRQVTRISQVREATLKKRRWTFAFRIAKKVCDVLPQTLHKAVNFLPALPYLIVPSRW